MKKNERDESLGTRLKGYERDFERRIDAEDYIVCRIDGHKFSKYTKGMKKPFDSILSETMVKTVEDLVEKFGAVTGYTQSDEISLIFAPQFKETLKPITFMDIETNDYGMCIVADTPEYRVFDREDNYVGILETTFVYDEEGYSSTTYYILDSERVCIDSCVDQGRNPQTRVKTETMFAKYLIKEVQVKNEQIFGGRIQKMASLIASFTTMRFNNHLSLLINTSFIENSLTETELKYHQKIISEKVGNAWFDARLYGVDSKEEAFNSVLFRTRDCIKNSYSMFAQSYVSHKSLLNKNGPEQIAYCLQESGKDWNAIEDGYKYGFLTKRESYEKTITNEEVDGRNQKHIIDMSGTTTVTRTRTVTWSEQLSTYSEEKVDMIVRKLL